MGFTEPDSAPQPPGQMPASTFDIQAPYSPGSPDPIASAGGEGYDTVAGSVAESVTKATARYTYHPGDIGDVYTLPPSPLDPGVGSLGEASPSGAYYDPPRNYGG